LEFTKRLESLAAQGTEGVCGLVDEIIHEGLHRSASDIHVEPSGESLLIRYRLDGVLHPAMEVRTDLAMNVVARVKVLADLLTYQTDVPQEGRIDREKVGASSDLRVSTFPTVRGEKIVIRLFDPTTQDVRLDELGYPPPVREGVILLTGPAGSGKTTTIYAALRYILDATGGARNIVTVEDPVERMLSGVTQTQVHAATGLTFARCLRSLMRQDPEVIVVGEIRDRETADVTIEAGLTGHLVISTIHSGTAAGVFTRLLEMQVQPHLLTSAMSLVVAQRLVRKLCKQCMTLVADEPALLGLPSDLLGRAYEPAGCDACFKTGYVGRTVIVETLSMAEQLRQKILARAATAELERVALDLGMTPLPAAALDAVGNGITSPAEICRVVGPELFAS